MKKVKNDMVSDSIHMPIIRGRNGLLKPNETINSFISHDDQQASSVFNTPKYGGKQPIDNAFRTIQNDMNTRNRHMNNTTQNFNNFEAQSGQGIMTGGYLAKMVH